MGLFRIMDVIRMAKLTQYAFHRISICMDCVLL